MTENILKQKVENWHNAVVYIDRCVNLLDDDIKKIPYSESYRNIRNSLSQTMPDYARLQSDCELLKERVISDRTLADCVKTFITISSKNLCIAEKANKFKNLYKNMYGNLPEDPVILARKRKEAEEEKRRKYKGPSVRIESIEFANGDSKGNTLSDYGVTLYTDTKYLTPLITYTNLAGNSIPVKLDIKIINPQGVVSSDSDSPYGYSYTENIPPNNREYNLSGWGNLEGNHYTEGTWRFEIWEKGMLLESVPVLFQTKQRSADRHPFTSVPKKKKKYGWIKLLLGLLLLVCVYQFWYKDYKRDKDAPRYYTFSNLNLRSSKEGDAQHNLLEVLPYGTELIVYSKGEEWSEVKVDEKNGFVSSDLILPANEFYLLNSVWGNTNAKECVESVKSRLALLDYYKRASLSGGVAWQLYTREKIEDKPNAVFYPRIYDRNSKFTDFIFVILNNQTRERMLVFYSFDEETEKPIYRYDMKIKDERDIKNVTGYWAGSKLKMTVTYSDGVKKTVSIKGNPPVSRSVKSSKSNHTNPAPIAETTAKSLNQKGNKSCEQGNYTAAMDYYKMASEKGLMEAKANLGWMYYQGLGTEQNGDSAVKYLKYAASYNNANACYYMGRLSETGVNGFHKDQISAIYYYEKGAKLGQKDAEKRLQELKSESSSSNENNSNTDKFYLLSEVTSMPDFPGRQENYARLLSSSIKYPKTAQERGVEGNVVCSFIIEKDGNITNVDIERGVGYLNEEVVRVIRSMPKWGPAYLNGVPVRMKHSATVTFKRSGSSIQFAEKENKAYDGLYVGKDIGVGYILYLDASGKSGKIASKAYGFFDTVYGFGIPKCEGNYKWRAANKDELTRIYKELREYYPQYLFLSNDTYPPKASIKTKPDRFGINFKDGRGRYVSGHNRGRYYSIAVADF